jgi:hypothetical protein
LKCPLCPKICQYKRDLVNHVSVKHDSEIPDNMSAPKYLYSLTHNGKTTGTCRICSDETQFDERTGRTKVFCSNPECKKAFAKIAKDRMMKVYGVTHLLNDQDHQMNMLSKRKISGVYDWSDGKTKIPYVGSYERKFLEFMDIMMDFDPVTIFSPCPFDIYYEFEGKILTHTPDQYIDIVDLVVEIKHGGDNPNMHPKIQAVDVAKDKAKAEAIRKNTTHNYIMITNNNFYPLIEALFKLVEDEKYEDKQRLFILNENTQGISALAPIATTGAYVNKDLYVSYFMDESDFITEADMYISLTESLDDLLFAQYGHYENLSDRSVLEDKVYAMYKYTGDINIRREIETLETHKDQEVTSYSDVDAITKQFLSIFKDSNTVTIAQLINRPDFTLIKKGRYSNVIN